MPKVSNSAWRWPAPTPKIARPPERRSRVIHALAVCSGCRYATTKTLDMRRTFSVIPAIIDSVATVSYHVVAHCDIEEARAVGVAGDRQQLVDVGVEFPVLHEGLALRLDGQLHPVD